MGTVFVVAAEEDDVREGVVELKVARTNDFQKFFERMEPEHKYRLYRRVARRYRDQSLTRRAAVQVAWEARKELRDDEV